MACDRDLNGLIEPLISGLVEDPLWSTFLAALRERTCADYASIVFRPLPFGPERNRVVHLYDGLASPPDLSLFYHDILHATDPMPYREMADGRVYALGDLLRAGDPDHDAYFREFLAPSGMMVLRMMRVVEPGGVSAWLTVSRREGAFTTDDDALLASLGPCLRAALTTHVALERERLTASVASEAIRRMNFGWITLDGAGRVLDADPHGARLLDDARILRRARDRRLCAPDTQTRREIETALCAVLQDPHARPRAMVLSRDPWLDMLLVASSLESGASRPAPALVAYIHADGWSSADRCEQLCQLFDLIPSEARLALALSRGMSIRDAAAELGLTVESARTYSKRIYAKTGARGQADLVRFIHRSVLAIA